MSHYYAVAEFLRARIAEDEAVAQTAGGDEWEYGDCSGSMQIQTVRVDGTLGYERHVAITRDYEGLSDSVDEAAGPHIALWDPAHVRDECETKREIINFCLAQSASREGRYVAESVMALMAKRWVDHPDYPYEPQ